MSYKVRFSIDPTKTITVEDQTINQELSVSFVGKNHINYAPTIAENFLHLLENFASVTAPLNPVQGQIWFDSTVGVNYLKLYNGVEWKPVGFIQKSNEQPSNPNIGDLWINLDSSTKQLMMYTGSTDPNKAWVLIGPENIYGNTGLFTRAIADDSLDPVSHEVIILSAQNENNSESSTVAVLSRDSFVPKDISTDLIDFNQFQQGINLPSALDSEIKLHGTATRADALVVTSDLGKELVTAEKFLRTDKSNNVYYQFSIDNTEGLIIKDPLDVPSSSQFSITVNDSIINLSALSNNKSIQFNVKQNDFVVSPLYIDPTGNIGVGTLSPTEKLEVVGNVKITGNLSVINNQNLLLNLNENNITLNVDLISKNITVDKISYRPSLPLLVSTPPPQSQPIPQYNSETKFIGYLEEESFLTGTWVGTSISPRIDLGNLVSLRVYTMQSYAEQFVMSITANSVVKIEGWYSLDRKNLLPLDQQNGMIYRINQNIPYVYFYSVAFNSESVSEDGRRLYSVLTNKAGDMVTFTLLANDDSQAAELNWRKITFFKITDDPNDLNSIKTAIGNINQHWIQ